MESLIPAVFGFVGTLVGGFIAGFVSLVVSRQARDAAERAWIRDSRRDIYDRFLTCGQRLLIACEDQDRTSRGKRSEAVEAAHVDFFEVYGVVQTVAERPVVDVARTYGYRLLALKEMLEGKGSVGLDQFDNVARLVRDARHDTIDAMRTELGLTGSARPPAQFDPFRGTQVRQK